MGGLGGGGRGERERGGYGINTHMRRHRLRRRVPPRSVHALWAEEKEGEGEHARPCYGVHKWGIMLCFICEEWQLKE